MRVAATLLMLVALGVVSGQLVGYLAASGIDHLVGIVSDQLDR